MQNHKIEISSYSFFSKVYQNCGLIFLSKKEYYMYYHWYMLLHEMAHYINFKMGNAHTDFEENLAYQFAGTYTKQYYPSLMDDIVNIATSSLRKNGKEYNPDYLDGFSHNKTTLSNDDHAHCIIGSFVQSVPLTEVFAEMRLEIINGRQPNSFDTCCIDFDSCDDDRVLVGLILDYHEEVLPEWGITYFDRSKYQYLQFADECLKHTQGQKLSYCTFSIKYGSTD